MVLRVELFKIKAERYGNVKRLVTRCESSPARIARGFSIPMNEGKRPASGSH